MSRPAARPSYVDPARRVAADVLLAVSADGAYGNLLLPRLLRERRIGGTDAAFATEITYGTLRWQGVLDAVIGAGADRDVAALDRPVLAVLRLGSYQLLHTRVPAHAAVTTSVDLCRRLTGPRPAGLVNAVLRRVADRSWPEWVDRLAPTDPLGRLAFERGYPRWIAVALLAALDGDVTELAAALTGEHPTVHLVARPGRMTRDELLAATGPAGSAGPWSPYAVRLSAGNPGELGAVRSGDAAVQDEGSQLVALATASAPLDGGDRHWLDMCAGPGGKAAVLAGLLPAGGRLLAADVRPHRVGLVRQALGSTGDLVVADGRRPAWRQGGFDRVLLDAPCTGLGALRRRPEVRWRREPGDVAGLHALQVGLLDAAVESVRPGGVVGYATCSPHRAETVDVVEAVRARRADVVPVDARPLVPGVPVLGAGPEVQLWPHRHGTDAMFLSLLRRTQ